MPKGQSLQEPFLNALRRERVPVAIYLVNGIKLQGQVESFDQFVVLLKNSVSQMIYKHAISTVVPARNVSVFDEEDEGLDKGLLVCLNGQSGVTARFYCIRFLRIRDRNNSMSFRNCAGLPVWRSPPY